MQRTTEDDKHPILESKCLMEWVRHATSDLGVATSMLIKWRNDIVKPEVSIEDCYVMFFEKVFDPVARIEISSDIHRGSAFPFMSLQRSNGFYINLEVCRSSWLKRLMVLCEDRCRIRVSHYDLTQVLHMQFDEVHDEIFDAAFVKYGGFYFDPLWFMRLFVVLQLKMCVDVAREMVDPAAFTTVAAQLINALTVQIEAMHSARARRIKEQNSNPTTAIVQELIDGCTRVVHQLNHWLVSRETAQVVTHGVQDLAHLMEVAPIRNELVPVLRT